MEFGLAYTDEENVDKSVKHWARPCYNIYVTLSIVM